MQQHDDDYWPPRPGSWEEAVEPFAEQIARLFRESGVDVAGEMPVSAFREPRQPYPHLPAAL